MTNNHRNDKQELGVDSSPTAADQAHIRAEEILISREDYFHDKILPLCSTFLPTYAIRFGNKLGRRRAIHNSTMIAFLDCGIAVMESAAPRWRSHTAARTSKWLESLRGHCDFLSCSVK